MQKKREVSEYRERLNETLSSPELSNDQTLKTLIRKQHNEECDVDILDQRVAALSSIIEKLRSVSTKDQDLSKSSNEASYGDWKVKHDDENCRVMYREGLKGSPFHTLLVEGCIDGTIEDCLCVCWESPLYEKWWPQLAFPSFRVLESKCLQKCRIDEQICLLRSVHNFQVLFLLLYIREANLNLKTLMIFCWEERVKAPWPLTDREAILQFFLFEYFKDGLVIILLNSIEVESNGIAEVVNAVRVDFVGGVAIQKVTPERSYMRFIAEVDIKLDLVPPSLINFISRQLLGNGFKLFKKTIGSVAKSDDYTRVLADPLYTQIHEALYSTAKTNEICQVNELYSQQGRDCEEKEPELEADDLFMAKENETRHRENEYVPFERDVPEIEEEDCVDEKEEDKSFPSSSSSQEGENVTGKTQNKNGKTRFCISPEVKQALGTLERVISMVRKSKTDDNNTSASSGEEEEASSSSMQHSGSTHIVSSSKVCIQDPKIELVDEASFAHYHNNNNNNNNNNNSDRRSGSSSFAREGNKIAHASPEIDLTTNSEVPRITVSQATTLFSQTSEKCDNKPSGLNGGKSSRLQRKRNPVCFGFRFWKST